MSDKPPIDKTRAALKNLEPWADDEISRLEKTFAVQRPSDDIAARAPRSRSSIVKRVLGRLKKGSFSAGFVLGLASGLTLSALIVLL